MSKKFIVTNADGVKVSSILTEEEAKEFKVKKLEENKKSNIEEKLEIKEYLLG